MSFCTFLIWTVKHSCMNGYDILEERWLFQKEWKNFHVGQSPPPSLCSPLSSHVLSFHLLFMKEFYWFWTNIFEIVRVASGCRASIETEECGRWGCSIWIQIEDEKSSLSRSLSFFSRRRIRNSICFYDFSCGALPMHIPTLVVKSHWGRVFFPSVCTLAAHCLEPVVGRLYCNLKSFFQ